MNPLFTLHFCESFHKSNQDIYNPKKTFTAVS